MQNFIKKLPEKYKYTIHNLIAHPMMEIFHLLGMSEISEKIHNITLPIEETSDETKLE